ncbi:Rhodanese/Cell cycle control phosphatase superfamily protein [Thalictrum thalictroides]|uniref:Rhodanese/Cell cycle control phosphatase superfamily protein n=1 Tax=Thalictrum thalictroides TaxID=46969 RepID=A0A7J6W659_THATH|nr:Rhodanese/Cell cycle control phosphatase superfamily protein [Thalictrum thalictroides]
MGTLIQPYPLHTAHLNFASPQDKLFTISHQITYTINNSSQTAHPTINVFPTSLSQSLPDDPLTTFKTSIDNFISLVSSSIDTSVGKGHLSTKNTLNAITSQLTHTVQTVNEKIDNLVSGLLSGADHSAELATNSLKGLSVNFKDSVGKAGLVSIDLLRRTIIAFEDYFATGISLILNYYGSVKELIPPEFRDILNSTETKAVEILGPVAAVFKQVYISIETVETNLGLDPNDPVVSLLFFLGTSATLGILYWILVFGGYSGDLSPQLTLELLTGEKYVVLIDIRPEDLRKRDGVPDLRRGARFKYASINLPEIDGSVRKLMKRERDLNATLTAAVIRNLKIVEGRSKVIVLDADGTHSKSIARSLRKLGVKKPYLVQGGFQSWVKNGLRIKELKPETTFSVLNEEAEAILEDIKPSPLQIVGYGVGFIAAIYALSEWEMTLQFIGVIGIGQTVYRRIASYDDSEDFKQDVRLLLGPFKVGANAFSWAAGKLEPNKIGLATSPSSTDVQSRVLQAAAKHESQPPASLESEEGKESSLGGGGNEMENGSEVE